MWLEDFCLTYRAGGADNDLFIIQYLPLYLAESARAWLEHLPANNIHSWADFKCVFVGNFQVTYVCPRNSWDLKAYKQKAGETLREYIHHFSKQCNELLDIVDTDMIRAFIFNMTNKALVHELGCYKSRTTRELLDLVTSHTFGEEVVRAIFCKYKCKAQAERANEAKDRNRRVKGKKDS